LSLYVDQSFEESNWQQSCYPIQSLNHAHPDEEWILEPAAYGLPESEENPFMLMDSNNLHETVFLPGPLPPLQQSKNALNNTQFLMSKKKNLAPVMAPSKQFCHSNMAQQPFYYPYRDKIVVTGKQIVTDTHCIANTSVPHPSCSTTYDNSTTTPPLNYTSPYSSAAAPAYIDTNYISCTQQSSPVAQVPSISGTSFDQVDYNSSSCFEPIYYNTNTSDVSFCQDNFYGNTVTTSEKSVDDWIQYLHSDDEEGCSPSYEQETLGINCDSLFPEFAEEDLTMLDTILAEETFSDSVSLPFHPQQQDMPAGSSAASPQYQYLPEEQPQQSQVIQYIPIAPKPADFQPAQSQSPTSSTSSSTTTTDNTNQRSRKRQRIVFNNSEEEYRIKRDLNNAASAKSREKKRQQQEFMKLEKVRLESRNRQLKNEVEEFERQIATLKDILYSKIKK
jgi:hypothetical protein